ncbi:MAG TPA: hypothetical protein VFH48_03730 [Chloroflexota bacterium]|nr:hypothetical protein [Chloroflexota bacterium]
MKGYRLDLARLAQESERPSDDPYLAVGRMLRDHLGGDPLAELRERCRGDPVLAEMAEIAGDLLRASPARSRRPRLTTSRRLRLLRAVDEIARQVDVASVSQPPKRSPG